MKISLLALIFVCSGFQLKAQKTIVWGSKVVDVSSEFTAYEYSAEQALYRPNVLYLDKEGIPRGGESPNAWRPKMPNKKDFITVSFDELIKAQQVVIAESENPGAITEIWAYDNENNKYLLFELIPRELPLEARLFNLFFPRTAYDIQAIKVVIDGSISEGFNSIDAIGLSTSNVPINILINTLPKVNEELSADSLGSGINSDYVEHSPIISPDGTRLYFSRQYHPDNIGGEDDPEDIWVSEMNPETGEWSPARNIGSPLNTRGPNFISSISMVNGEEVFILGNRYGKKGKMYTGVSMSKRLGETFTVPKDIIIENEYNYAPVADFFLASGGKALLMSTERDDSYGGKDLYVSFQKTNGKWSEPENLGADINTPGEEKAPFLSDDGKTLYFSSDGYNGYGGQDIYVSFRVEQDSWIKWSEPENLGPGVNKEADDAYLSVPTSGFNLYFSRARKSDEDTDIYAFKMEELFMRGVSVDQTTLTSSLGHLKDPDSDWSTPLETEEKPVDDKPVEEKEEAEEAEKGIFMTVNGQLINSKENQPLAQVTVRIETLPDGLSIGTVETDESGNFSFSLRAGAHYAMIGEVEGFISQDENFDFSEVTVADTIYRNLLMYPIEKGEKIVLNNIFFAFDKAVLKTSSYPELKRIITLIEEGQIKKIIIFGHTDAVGSESYNLVLSRRRAKAVMDFFLNNGVSTSQVSSEGFGELDPIATNDTEDGRAKNRRVELQIVE